MMQGQSVEMRGMLREPYSGTEDVSKMSLSEQKDHFEKQAAELEEKLIEVMSERDRAQEFQGIHERYLRVLEGFSEFSKLSHRLG